ncbi:MAG: hypothetical protein A2X22_01310 [Bacteroidetes bacterium GWF2_49_14]|nr:MAG: hypothetical protein A2X22_01310 [Bacteroidetes bacterium GWF2_49_14]
MRILAALLLAILSFLTSPGQTPDRVVTKEHISLTSVRIQNLAVDTTLPGSQNHNPLYSGFYSWTELGNSGMPAVRNRFSLIRDALMPNAMQGYESYSDQTDRLTFYRAKSPFTLVNYNSGGTQDKHGQTIRGLYARDLKKEGNLTVFGTYINSDGHYSAQKSNTSVIQANYILKRENYSLVAGVSRQKFNSGENGGLRDDNSLVGSAFTSTLPVKLSSATSNTGLLSIQGLQTGFIRMKKDTAVRDTLLPPDSTQSAKPASKGLHWEHQFAIRNFTRKYADESPPAGFYPMVSGVLEDFADSLQFTTFSNELRFVPDTIRIMGNAIAVKAGLNPDIFRYKYQDTVFSGFRLGVGGEMDFQFRKSLFNIHGNWILAGFSAGDYVFGATWARSFGQELSGNQLALKLYSQGSSPDPLIINYNSAVYTWNNLFLRQHETGVDIDLSLAKAGLGISLMLVLDKNRIYFNDMAMPAQAPGSMLTGVLEVSKHLKAGPFRSDISLMAQYTTSDYIRLPLASAFTTAYMHHDIHFKTTGGMLELEYGLDFRYNTPFTGYSYMPATGNFYLQNSVSMGNYPWLDFFAQIKVKRTRLFVEWCHTFSGILAENSFSAAHYPYMRPHLKYGVYWHFYD